jgi:hypothetical protein
MSLASDPAPSEAFSGVFCRVLLSGQSGDEILLKKRIECT